MLMLVGTAQGIELLFGDGVGGVPLRGQRQGSRDHGRPLSVSYPKKRRFGKGTVLLVGVGTPILLRFG